MTNHMSELDSGKFDQAAERPKHLKLLLFKRTSTPLYKQGSTPSTLQNHLKEAGHFRLPNAQKLQLLLVFTLERWKPESTMEAYCGLKFLLWTVFWPLQQEKQKFLIIPYLCNKFSEKKTKLIPYDCTT